jgi:hypothetical protein
MTSRAVEPTYPALELILDAVANWVRKHRGAAGLRDQWAQWEPEEIARTAHDIGVSPDELIRLAKKGPHAAERLPRLLCAVGVDPWTLSRDDPAMMRDMQRLCTACSHKSRCEREIAAGTAAHNYRSFCPNTASLETLLAPT